MSNNIIIDKYLKYLNEFNKNIFNVDRYKEYDDFIDNEFIPLQIKIKESRINIEQENITKPTLYESNKLEPTSYESNKLKYTPYEINKLEPISKPDVFDKITSLSNINSQACFRFKIFCTSLAVTPFTLPFSIIYFAIV